MRISLKIHTLAVWKFFVLIFLIVLLILIFLVKIDNWLWYVGCFLILSVIFFFLFRRKYFVFHKAMEVKSQIEKVLLLLSFENRELTVWKYYVKKYNMYIGIVSLGVFSMVYFNTKKNSKQTKYIETVMLKYQRPV